MDSPNFLFSIPLVGVEGRRGGRSFHPSETPITLCGPCYGGPQPSMLQQRLPYPRTTKAGNHCAEVFPPFTGGRALVWGMLAGFSKGGPAGHYPFLLAREGEGPRGLGPGSWSLSRGSPRKELCPCLSLRGGQGFSRWEGTNEFPGKKGLLI